MGNTLPTEYYIGTIHNFSAEAQKRIRMHERLWLEIAEGFHIILCNF